MHYESDYVVRIIEQMGAALREAFVLFRGGAGPEDSLAMTEAAMGLAVDMDPKLFLQLSPQSMVSLVEISSFDDRLVQKLADAIILEAEILEADGNIIEAQVRREQAAALRNTLGPAHAN